MPHSKLDRNSQKLTLCTTQAGGPKGPDGGCLNCRLIQMGSAISYGDNRCPQCGEQVSWIWRPGFEPRHKQNVKSGACVAGFNWLQRTFFSKNVVFFKNNRCSNQLWEQVSWRNQSEKRIFIYCTCAIITRGLYISNPLLEGQKRLF